MEKDSSKHSSSIELEKTVGITGASSGDVGLSDFSVEDAMKLEKSVWLKVDLYVLPVITVFYLLSWLDRTNFGNARVAGLQEDLALTPTQYSMALTVTFIPYIATELPSNLLLKVIGPNLLLPTLMLCWGIVTTLQGLVTNYGGLLACRFFIGFFEGGLLPGVVLYLSSFYPRTMLQSRISIFFSAASLSGAFSGLLATGISKMGGKGGRPAWAWIFILEGLFTVIFGAFAFWVLPATPNHAKFLSQKEKDYVVGRLREAGAISDEKTDGFSWAEVGRTFKLPHIWFLFFIYFFNGTIVYSLGYFAPSIVLSLGFSPIRSQLMSVPPFAAAFVLTITAAFFADRYRARGLVAIFSSLCCIIGFAMYLGSTKKWVLYGSMFLTVGGINCSSPALAAWLANNTAPHVRRATAIAFLSMVTNGGGVLSTWLLGSLSAPPRWTKAMTVLLVFSILMGVFMGINLYYLWDQNKKKKVIRETTVKEDEPIGLGDRSAWFEYIL